MEVQSSDVEIKLGGVMTATTDSTPTTNNKKPKMERFWCNLPGNVLISIIERLYYVHQIYFLAVCKDWRTKIYGLVRHSDNFPWVLAAAVTEDDILSRKFVSNSSKCHLYDPIHKQKFTIENKILDSAQIHASKFGWLLLSTNINSTYFFSFYSPFTNEIIELPALDMNISGGKVFTKVMATFSDAPTSSDCVICVLSTKPLIHECLMPYCLVEFRVSTFSPGGKTWNNVLLGTNGIKYNNRISGIALVDGVLYFIFQELRSQIVVMGVLKLGLEEWKAYPYPRKSHVSFMGCLIESEDNENLFMLYVQACSETWHVCQFNRAEKNWCEVENLGSRMLFVSATSTSLQLAAAEKEEDGEGMGSFANTIHVAHNIYKTHLGCSSHFYNTPDKHHPSCPQIYDWIDKEGPRLTWIQPPQINLRLDRKGGIEINLDSTASN